jgi:hypothetical protein
MSTLPPLADPNAQARCENVLNPDIRRKFAQLKLEGKNVYLADIASPTLISLNDIRDDDGVHFTDAGYERVASMWTDVIQKMDEEGAISPATDTEYPDYSEGDGDPNCKKEEGDSYGPVETQFGTRSMLKRISVSRVSSTALTASTRSIC